MAYRMQYSRNHRRAAEIMRSRGQQWRDSRDILDVIEITVPANRVNDHFAYPPELEAYLIAVENRQRRNGRY